MTEEGALGEDRLVALIDESADRRYYRVGALVVRLRDVAPLARELTAVMVRAHEKFGIDPATELHAHRMFHGNEAWRELHPRQRIGVYGEALDVVGELAETILIRGVHRPGHRARYQGRFSEHEAALTFVMEELDRYAESEGQSVHIFADDCRFAASARRWLATYQEAGTWGYRARVLRQIAQLEFVDSATYRQIQGIDLVTYMKTRIASGVEKDSRAVRANAQLWERVSRKVHVDQIWYP